MLYTLDTLFRFVSILMQEVISSEPIPDEYVEDSFQVSGYAGSLPPQRVETAFVLYCLECHFLIRTLLPPMSHHHVAPHPTQPTPHLSCAVYCMHA